ncbi:enoyl-CoA hydratase-related protein [Streptomyces sp. NPDC050743]|uniref:enoyl-CoA hydratase-related protein n=1 Tax=Streptomyces sp. NPDC050743 TaxID=3365634 RepID=UPI00378A30D1
MLRHDQRLLDVAGGNGVPESTLRRRRDEMIGLLAASAPRLDRALLATARRGGDVVLIGSTLIPTQRRTGAEDRPNHCGKHHRHGLHFLALTDKKGRLIRISAARPGRTTTPPPPATTGGRIRRPAARPARPLPGVDMYACLHIISRSTMALERGEPGMAEELASGNGHQSPDGQPVGDDMAVARSMDGPVAVLTMQHRPHNFMGYVLLDALLESIRWAHEQGARAVLLRSGLRNFSAGADLALFDGLAGQEPEIDRIGFLHAFDELPMPIVAAVHGVCVGGGFELALACDLIVAGESAKLGSVEATLGLNPLSGAVQRLAQRAGAARAKEMAMLARRYDARTLERWNVINRVVADDMLDEVALSLAQELGHGATVAHASTKAIVSYALENGVRAADEKMAELQRGVWASRDLQHALESVRTTGLGSARFEGR